MKKTKTMTIEEHPQRTILGTCDLWDTDYISDNWEQQSQHSQWPLNNEWQGQHLQFLQCFYMHSKFDPHPPPYQGLKFSCYASSSTLWLYTDWSHAGSVGQSLKLALLWGVRACLSTAGSEPPAWSLPSDPGLWPRTRNGEPLIPQTPPLALGPKGQQTKVGHKSPLYV